MAASEADNTSCARPADTAKVSWIAGNAGRKICMAIGPSAVIDARISMSVRSDTGVATCAPDLTIWPKSVETHGHHCLFDITGDCATEARFMHWADDLVTLPDLKRG